MFRVKPYSLQVIMGSGAAGMGLLGQHSMNPTANLMPKTSQVVVGVPYQQKSSKVGGLRPCPSYKPFCITASLTMGKPSASVPAQPYNFPGVYVVCRSGYDLFICLVIFGGNCCIHCIKNQDTFTSTS